MRVLCIIDSLVAGGAERSLAAVAPHLIGNGVILDVAYLHERQGVGDQLVEAGAGIHSLAGPGGRLGWLRRARDLIQRQQPDLVHTTLFESDVIGRLAARSCGVPVVSSIVNVAYGPEQLADPRLRRSRVRAAHAVDALTARLAVRLHAVSRDVATTMGARLRVPRDRIHVVPRGRDDLVLGRRSADRRAEVRDRLGVGPTTPLVLTAARHEHQKGIDRLLRAVPAIQAASPGTVVLVAGRRGSATPELERLAADLEPGRVLLLGARDDVADLLVASDVYVLASRWEGLPNTLIEALALETPIVASDIPGVREVCGDLATVIDADDPIALAAAAARALQATPATVEATRLGRERFERRFRIEAVAAEMVRFYEGAIAD